MKRAVRLLVLVFLSFPWMVHAQDYYVSDGSGNDANDGLSWASPKKTIQAAVNAAGVGATVWVSNGVYATGGEASGGFSMTRVVVDKAVTVQSVWGAIGTTIQGAGPHGPGAARCVRLANGAALSGFRLINGHTEADASPLYTTRHFGGGAYVESGATLTGCLIYSNSAAIGGGGLVVRDGGVVSNCYIMMNNARDQGGGVQVYGAGLMTDCIIAQNTASNGGGLNIAATAPDGLVDRCSIVGNVATNGGGVYGQPSAMPVLRNCLVTGNKAYYGAGTLNSSNFNCTIAWNVADTAAGGVGFSFNENCIVWYNTGPHGGWNHAFSTFQYGSTDPAAPGPGNLNEDPSFLDNVNGDYRLKGDSPCLNAGVNRDWMAGSRDLDLSGRIVDGTVDMGAYEGTNAWAGVEDKGGGWNWSDWFGWFIDAGQPWIWHKQHGWMYTLGVTTRNLWLWTYDQGWIWTSHLHYSYLYRLASGQWLWYQKDSAGPRWFYNLNTGLWESL